ncbi:hypothetical protein EVAR_25777_1 [Eumeta japonica]|uniref:Uncharacterized protein n=1 Tax=Eumeta variegata TaxID=151549 RepID=A0A4C1VUU9_EUMVA|nr:hypothetical protein EVAR_25777_1 [Eumeta japonica]
MRLVAVVCTHRAVEPRCPLVHSAIWINENALLQQQLLLFCSVTARFNTSRAADGARAFDLCRKNRQVTDRANFAEPRRAQLFTQRVAR